MKVVKTLLLVSLLLLVVLPAYSLESWKHFGQCFAILELARQTEDNPTIKADLEDAVRRSQYAFLRTASKENQSIDTSSLEAFQNSMRDYLKLFDTYNRALEPNKQEELVSTCYDEFM